MLKKRVIPTKKIIFSIFLLLLLFWFSACKTTTMSDKPSGYIYGINEEIKVLDIDSMGELGSLKITDAIILINEPFVIPEIKKYDENDNPIYENVKYEQLVQINYVVSVIDSTKSISKTNFSIWDSKNVSVKFDPEIEYKNAETSDNSFVIALKNKSDFINIDFKFYPMQSGVTAKIKAGLDEQNKMQSPVSTASAMEDTGSDNDSKISDFINYNLLFTICIVLFCIVIGLSITIIIILTKRKK